MDSAVGQVDESLNSIRTEWNVLKQKWFFGETLDPVFEGMVKDFCVFDVTMQDIYKKVEVFMKGVDNLAEGLLTLSESVTGGLAHVDDALIASDSCKLKEATNQISRADAPHSAIAKIRRDMDFNIMNPIRLHLINNRNLKAHLDKRRRKLLELNTAKKQYDDMTKKDVSKTDRKYLNAQAALEAAKMGFHEVDRHVFEWLYILEEYRGDILDSTLQTLKYLQYEFFATSAHAISGVLPARMEFRPMVEMTPDHLNAQVEMELQEAEDAGEEEEPVTDFSRRLIEKMSKDNKAKPGDGLDSSASDAGPALPVDPLSLSSLLSHGFEEGPARRALRLHQNNTQAALDWLVDGGADGAENIKTNVPEDGVRMPTTIKRIQKLKAMRRAQQEKIKRQEAAAAENDDSEEEAAPERPSKPEKVEKPAESAAVNLLDFEEPPPPTDFTKQVNVMELPAMVNFESESRAAAAAGTPMQPLAAASMPAQPQIPQLPAGGATDANAALLLLQQAQISPQQLLQAAQALAAQQAQAAGAPAAAPAVPAPAMASPLGGTAGLAMPAMPGLGGMAAMSTPPAAAPSPDALQGLMDFQGIAAPAAGAPAAAPGAAAAQAKPASSFDALNPLAGSGGGLL
mmetsp:Transcript_58978/g.140817  ORF Transcript_58978/g.140817 Transcript_58978/m.140817 type:complete len:627 (-) Transcript_58978:116-1996(-)|eukprot:CAMPEP_0178431858 /NCGR_PEP_ID=MMETSP0689_2-20121128/32080_1 /TAXON_ID=160604 /ORGANISM="Amphidinium massartii, Strain CS-259" /LENGTH=626 /DNA_ID=CAMNT_0020053815 /DNA_START=75 /DNA_END=1955 /DNA_ORIENTATION=-